jgi:exonuclease VII small subunit
MSETDKTQTLEDKLLRLQTIQQMIEQKKVTLSQSIPLIEEAYQLKIEIETELTEIESKLTKLNISTNGTQINEL